MIYILLPLIFFTNLAMADFFRDISKIISNNIHRLSYGVAVTDFNLDNKFEFIVAGHIKPINNFPSNFKILYIDLSIIVRSDLVKAGKKLIQ